MQALERFRIGRLAALSLSLVLVGGLAACDDDGAAGPVNPAGSYTLILVDGEAPPTHFYQWEGEGTSADVHILDGWLDLSDDNSFTHSTDYEYHVMGDQWQDTTVESGTYTIDGTDITFVVEEVNGEPQTDHQVPGTVAGDQITVTIPEQVDFPETTWVYER